ncbi:MAG: hypothetical protein AAF598_15885 [Bacteroidota bacterium]
MKLMYTLLFLVGLSPILIAQSQEVDQRLVDALGQETVDDLSVKSPFLLEYKTALLDHSWEIQDFPEDKLASMPEINLKRSELRNPNVLIWMKKLNLTRAKDHHKYYRIGRSNQVLVLFSEDHFAEQFNKLSGRVK